MKISVTTAIASYRIGFFRLFLWGFAMIISDMNFNHCFKKP